MEVEECETHNEIYFQFQKFAAVGSGSDIACRRDQNSKYSVASLDCVKPNRHDDDDGGRHNVVCMVD